MPPGPPRTKTEHVFPVGIHTQSTYIQHIYTWLTTWINTDTSTQHSNTHTTNGLILFPSPADQDEGLSVGNPYVCSMWILPTAVLRHSFQPAAVPGSQPAQLLTLGHRSSRCCCPAPVACAREYKYMPTHTLWTPPVRGIRHSVYPVTGPWILRSPVASCAEMHTCKWVSQLIPRPYSVSSSWLGPPGPSGSQLADFSYLSLSQPYDHFNTCLLSFLPTHHKVLLNTISHTDTRIHTVRTHSNFSSCWHPEIWACDHPIPVAGHCASGLLWMGVEDPCIT